MLTGNTKGEGMLVFHPEKHCLKMIRNDEEQEKRKEHKTTQQQKEGK
jgi:hypothetical protein